MAPVEPEGVKERPECYEDDDDENLPFTNELKAIGGIGELPNAHYRTNTTGRGDPSNHINIYKTKLQGQSPVVKCLEFPYHAHIRRRRGEGKTVKSYFKFSNVINKIKTVTDEKALDALVTGLYMRTPFWRDVQNSQPKTYSQLVDLVQCVIRSEEMIENKEKAERERGDCYRRDGRRSLEPRFSRFLKKHSSGPRNSHYVRFNKTEVVPVPLPKAPRRLLYQQRHHPSSVVYTGPGYTTWNIAPDGRRPPPWHQDNGPRRNGGRNDRNRDPPRLNGPAEAPPIQKINTIIGGSYVGGHTMNSRQNYTKAAREEPVESWQVHGHRPKALLISFTEEDEVGIHYPHCDALVVRVIVAINGLG
ncbi:Retrotrans gag domain-containing protein [Abeliophyllum distichum]|uniref:Retrotrans gag domain-containing protein n=1 Tax=Abeliophyllum distichum TaxID=126358 RepID=A0ABD1V390_9LAMI